MCVNRKKSVFLSLFFLFVGCSKCDFFRASMSSRSLNISDVKKHFLGPSRGVQTFGPVTISLNISFVKKQFLGPSRGVTPLGPLLFFSSFFFLVSLVPSPPSPFWLWGLQEKKRKKRKNRKRKKRKKKKKEE